MTFAERLRKYRKKAHMTQKQLADKANLAEITVRQYEGGLYEPKQGALGRIALALGISIVDLMGWDEEIDVKKIAEAVRFMEEAKRIGGNVYKMNHAFEQLNEAGQDKVIAYAEDLLQIPVYCLDDGLTEE